jgi:hypothetical protein
MNLECFISYLFTSSFQYKQCWFGPYRIQYLLPKNTTFLVIIHKFDPNPILININKLKSYWFQDPNAFKGLESIVKRGRDTTNTKIRLNIASQKNVEGTSTKLSLDGSKIQKSWLGIKIQDPLVQVKNLEDRTGIEICSIGTKTFVANQEFLSHNRNSRFRANNKNS